MKKKNAGFIVGVVALAVAGAWYLNKGNGAHAEGQGGQGPGARGGMPPVTVNVVEELGADAYVYGTAKVGDDGKDLVVRVSGRDVPEKGSTLHVVPRSGETHVFSTSTGARLSD